MKKLLSTNNKCIANLQVLIPMVDRVSEEVVVERLAHQGLTKNYKFYSKDKYIGSIQTELWKEANLLLIHSIGASAIGLKYGTAMISWLVSESTEVIQPVHVIGGGIGFWQKLKLTWPDRVANIDLRSSDYDDLLEKRKIS